MQAHRLDRDAGCSLAETIGWFREYDGCRWYIDK